MRDRVVFDRLVLKVKLLFPPVWNSGFTWDDTSIVIGLDRLVADFGTVLVEKHIVAVLFVLRRDVIQTAWHLVAAIELNVLRVKNPHRFTRNRDLLHHLLRLIDAGLSLLFHDHLVHQLTHLSELAVWITVRLVLVIKLLLAEILESVWCLRKSQSFLFWLHILLIIWLLLILIAVLGEKQLLVIASDAKVVDIVVDNKRVVHEFVLKTVVRVDESVEDRGSNLRVQWEMALISQLCWFLFLCVFVVLQHQMIA